MTTPPKRTLPPVLDEVWKTFITNAGNIDPARTITTSGPRAVPQMREIVPEQPSTPLAASELPSVSIEPDAVAQGDRVGADFEVTGVLGEGGMGRVLLARQRSLQRDVALKVLKGATSKRDMVDTLLAEAIITGSIEHPSIVPVHALGRDSEGRPVLVMKRIEGVSWRNLVQDPQHPAWASLAVEEGDRLDAHLEILMAVCNAAHFAHTRAVVHRDIKLDNVMIGGFGEVYLVDWGIAVRIAGSKDGETNDNPESYGAPVGTLVYMAPEMAIGNVALIDARTDVYLLGATLHFILTGKPRHQGEMMIELLFSARDSDPVDYGPEVPAELAAICNRAMHVDQDKRFQSALEMRQALSSFRRHRGSIALANKAMARLEEIDALFAQQGKDAFKPDDERLLYKLMTECRFGLMQALDGWKGNQAARVALDQCIERMVEHEIAQRDVEGARALLTELSAARPELERKVEALAVELGEAKAREEQLAAMARDADLRIGARFQLAIFMMVPLCLLVAIIVVLQSGQDQVTNQQLIVFPLVLLMMVAGAFFAVGKRLTTAVSRRVFAFMLLSPVATFAHRALALTHGGSVASILAADMVLAAALFAALAITILPHVGWVAGWLLAGAIAVSRFPAQATPIFLICASVAVLVTVVIWGRLTSRQDS